jgi:hypothetical protein
MEDVCKIHSPFYYNKEENKLKLRSLNGGDRYKFFENMYTNKVGVNKKDQNIFNNIDNKKILKFDNDTIINNLALKCFDNVFEEFFFILNNIKKLDVLNLDQLKLRLKKWLRKYVELGGSEEITPYIHIFVFHVPELIKKYRNINLFNCQGLEKLNELTIKDFHTSTNKKKQNKAYLKQLFEKRNRIEFYELNGHNNIFS